MSYWAHVNDPEPDSVAMREAPDDLEAFFTLQEHMWDWLEVPAPPPLSWWTRVLQVLGFR